MIELQIIEKLKASVASLPIEKNQIFGHWQWQVHRFDIQGKDCVLCLEKNSSYSMLFFDLKDMDFANFQQVWQYRLLAEALTVSNLNELDSNSLQAQLMEQCANVWLTQAHEQHKPLLLSENQAVREVKHLLHRLYKIDGKMPENQAQEFDWGVRINKARRNLGIAPYCGFREHCQSLAKRSAVFAKSAAPVVLH